MSPSDTIATVLRKMEYGVYVVTLGKGNKGNAFTASWVTQISSDPPMVAMAIHNKHQSSRLLSESDAFVIHFIPEGQDSVAKTYYGPAESGYEKLKATSVTDSPATGTPIIPGSLGFLDCKIVKRIPAGNHTLFLGEVKAASVSEDKPILTTSNCRLHYTG
jgi:flavin reductase (DIM6/NTAB) family NADH-FMN oxidoreductase RutF